VAAYSATGVRFARDCAPRQGSKKMDAEDAARIEALKNIRKGLTIHLQLYSNLKDSLRTYTNTDMTIDELRENDALLLKATRIAKLLITAKNAVDAAIKIAESK
jgi:hypothetical protein